jgi:hypothetical protein
MGLAKSTRERLDSGIGEMSNGKVIKGRNKAGRRTSPYYNPYISLRKLINIYTT